MSNHENEIQFESYLKEIKENVDASSDEIRAESIKEGMNKMRSKIGNLDIKVNPKLEKKIKNEAAPRFKGAELADNAIDVYKHNVKGEEESPKAKDPIDHACTKASRENVKAVAASLAGRRTSGDSGKASPTGPGGSGNTSGYGGEINVGLYPTTMTMEEYKEFIFKDFGLIEEKKESFEELKEEETPEEVSLISEIEASLLSLESRDWMSVDKEIRALCVEHNVSVKDVNKEFRSIHGMYPDKWIKEQVEIEHCGWFPLDELARVNRMGMIYDVSFMHRGKTQRVKFFWPQVNRPTKKQMQGAVEKLYPKAVLLAYYPSMNQDGINHMIMVPPMTENYEMIPQEMWVEMTEEESKIYEMICEEEGEPLSPPVIQEDGSTLMFIEDHDTGEEREVMWEANKSGDNSLRDWFGKSKSSDGTKGWVQLGGKFAGKPCAKQEGQTTKPKCGSSKMKRDLNKDEEQAAFRRKNREDGDPNRSGKAKNVRTEEVVMEGEKDACYNKVKSRYKVWPSAYASGALVKCRQKGAANWGNSKKNEEVTHVDEDYKKLPKVKMGMKAGKKFISAVKDTVRGESEPEGTIPQQIGQQKADKKTRQADKIHKIAGDHNETLSRAKSMKNKLVGMTKKEEVEHVDEGTPNSMKEEVVTEGDEMKGLTQKGGHKRSTESGAGLTQKGVDAVNRKTGGNLKTAVTTPPSKLDPDSKPAKRRKSFCARSKGWTGERGKAARKRWNC